MASSQAAQLRAYTSPDVCRTAGILKELTAKSGTSNPSTLQIVDRWTQIYPVCTQRNPQPVQRTIRSRVSKALKRLREAEVITTKDSPEGVLVTVISPELLELMVKNLALIVDSEGYTLYSSDWLGPLNVPNHLKDRYQELEDQRRLQH